jgi:hypothetical protein
MSIAYRCNETDGIVPVISRAQVSEMAARFASLNPYDRAIVAESILKIENVNDDAKADHVRSSVSRSLLNGMRCTSELLHLVYRWTGQTSAGKHIARRVKACRSALRALGARVDRVPDQASHGVTAMHGRSATSGTTVNVVEPI